MEDYDLFLARQLQEEFDKESASLYTINTDSIDNHCSSGSETASASRALSVIDASWETTDPNPDIHALFLQYNKQYFWGKLAGVEVKWSPRMTLCAGVCSYEGRGGLCSIRLSVPLLKLRPRKDLVETLLHEMIHAYLFVTENDRDRDGHGPNFQKHMHRINKASGAHITIYHDFHDEVDSYRQHWWRCNGPCRSRPPFYGWVKRAMNRAPSANDFWWEDHARSCGGSYTKVKEPEGYGQKKKGSKEMKKDEDQTDDRGVNMDIRNFFGNTGQQRDVKSKTSASSKKSSGPVIGSRNPSSTSSSPADNSIRGYGSSNSNSFGSSFGDNTGIWTPERSSWSTSSSQIGDATGERSLSKEGTTVPSQHKNWTAVETNKDRSVKVSASSSSGVQRSESAGNILGSDYGGGLSWLARMRKQWSEEGNQESKTVGATQKSAKSKLLTEQLKTVKENSDVEASSCCSNTASGTWTRAEVTYLKTKPEEDVDSVKLPLNGDSPHSSFHVSSCEEDEWPTPEEYKVKHKTITKLPKCKRTEIEYISSDEENDMQPDSKRIKYGNTANANSDLGNTFQKTRMKSGQYIEERHKRKKSLSHASQSDTPRERCDTGTSQNQINGIPSHEIETSSPRGANVSQGHGMFQPVPDMPNISLVTCPACQKMVPAGDINSHLDICLS